MFSPKSLLASQNTSLISDNESECNNKQLERMRGAMHQKTVISFLCFSLVFVMSRGYLLNEFKTKQIPLKNSLSDRQIEGYTFS